MIDDWEKNGGGKFNSVKIRIMVFQLTKGMELGEMRIRGQGVFVYLLRTYYLDSKVR